MVTRALARYLKIAPKKLQPVLRLVRRKPVEEALYILFNTNNKGAGMLKSVIHSAVSNAKRLPEKNLKEEDLFISKVTANEGPVLKRFRAMSMGRAGTIRKRTSHILVELDLVPKSTKETKVKTDKVKEKRKKTVKAGK